MTIWRWPTWKRALAAPGPAYDLILAADTLVYLGDLAAVFARRAAAPESGRLFSVHRGSRPARVSNSAPSAAGATAKPICATRP